MLKFTLYLSFILFISCKDSSESRSVAQEEDSIPKKESKTQNIEINNTKKDAEPNLDQGDVVSVKLDDQIYGQGVLVMKSEPEGLSLSDTLRVLNSDNSTFLAWCYRSEFFRIKPYNYNLFEVTDKILSNYGLNPRAFFLEYQIIHFEVLNETETYYEVIIDPEINAVKRIMKDSNWVYYPWEKYIETLYLSYDIDNPLRSEPDEDARVIYKFNDYFFKAIEIEGDWIKVRCDDDCKKCDKGNLEGWIKWKKGKRLLVSLGIIC